ncbi:Mg2+/Co2+ transporter CorB [Faecalicoccus acidiformans]|uniref:Mg2+/Co2+ transporter CorB n=1 Tax=Faecalicoccus acidiformans TaxID=915173 RepID=A0A7W8D2N6_9FIRM|nr:hypothetical protein [Faecalicoccus acidiformans]MBB5184833.1 Mg2+/Co2+ transporter CorB [Faecalicoccus acidiformans]
MTVKELCVTAIIGAIEFVVFTSFSFILYLECITFTVLIFSVVFPRKIAVSGAVVFGLLNIVLIQGALSAMICLFLYHPTKKALCAIERKLDL